MFPAEKFFPKTAINPDYLYRHLRKKKQNSFLLILIYFYCS